MRTNRNQAFTSTNLDMRSFIAYCKLFLIDNMFKEIPVTSILTYGRLYIIINSIEDYLFKEIDTEQGKILLANKIFSLVKSVTNEEFDKEFLYNLIDEISTCKPVDKSKQLQNILEDTLNEFLSIRISD